MAVPINSFTQQMSAVTKSVTYFIIDIGINSAKIKREIMIYTIQSKKVQVVAIYSLIEI